MHTASARTGRDSRGPVMPVQHEADDALDMHSVYSENGRRLKSYEKTAKEELTPEGLDFRFDNTFITVNSGFGTF